MTKYFITINRLEQKFNPCRSETWYLSRDDGYTDTCNHIAWDEPFDSIEDAKEWITWDEVDVVDYPSNGYILLRWETIIKVENLSEDCCDWDDWEDVWCPDYPTEFRFGNHWYKDSGWSYYREVEEYEEVEEEEI